MRSMVALMLVIALAMVGTGCGGSGDDASATSQGNEPTTGNGGDVDGGALPESVRADFPVDIPAGWEIDIHGELGLTDTTGAQLLYPADAYDSLVAFYDEWIESQSEEYARTASGDQVIYTGTGSVYSITITPDHQERDQSWTLLQVITPGD